MLCSTAWDLAVFLHVYFCFCLIRRKSGGNKTVHAKVENCATMALWSVSVPYHSSNIAGTRKFWQHYKYIPQIPYI